MLQIPVHAFHCLVPQSAARTNHQARLSCAAACGVAGTCGSDAGWSRWRAQPHGLAVPGRCRGWEASIWIPVVDERGAWATGRVNLPCAISYCPSLRQSDVATGWGKERPAKCAPCSTIPHSHPARPTLTAASSCWHVLCRPCLHTAWDSHKHAGHQPAAVRRPPGPGWAR